MKEDEHSFSLRGVAAAYVRKALMARYLPLYVALLAVILTLLSLRAGLLSKEAGIATCAYLFSYELFIDCAPWIRRCKALLGYVLVVLIWRLAWSSLGYGVLGISIYVDPIREPLYFAVEFVKRAPLYLLGQWALPPSEIALVLDSNGTLLLWIGALLFLTLLAVIMWPVIRHDRISRFWALGMILSVIPACTAIPGDRMLFFVGLGAMGVLAQFFVYVFGRQTRPPKNHARQVACKVLAYLLILIHLIIAPLGLPVRAGYPMGTEESYKQLYVNTVMDSTVEKQDVIIVNPPVAITVMLLPVFRELEGQPVPLRVRVLSPALKNPLTVHRLDAQTLVVRPDKGYLLEVFDRIFRDDRHPMQVGQRVELTGMTIEVTELTEEGRPAEAIFRFAVPLEDSSLRWLQWKNGEFIPFRPPAIGGTLKLEASTPSIQWPGESSG